MLKMYTVVFLVTFASVSCDNGAIQMFPPLPVTVTKSANTVCRQHGDMYLDNLKNFTLWAHEMWDATAKSSTGVLRGSRFQLGHFEQCLSANAPFTTKYCLASIKADIPRPEVDRDELSLYYDPNHSVFERLYQYNDNSQQSRKVIEVGWCIPSSCSVLDLEEYLNEYLNNLNNQVTRKNVTYSAKFVEHFCTTVEDTQYFDKADISFCFLAVVLIVMVILATAYDYMNSSKKVNEKPLKSSRPSRMLMAFSARKNFLELSRADDTNPALKIMYGVRTVCILAIIMDHRFGTYVSSALLNFNYVEEQYRSFTACIFFHGDLFVDTFFLLSGILVMYGLLNQFDKKIMNPLSLIVLRYVRLTPVYAFVIFYYATIFNHSGEGPLWKVIAGGDSKDCRNNWWTNLLYISNYVNPEHMCMTHSWYLPCDFHYFIIAIFLCILMKKQRKIGLGILTVLTVVSIAVPFGITIAYQRPGLMHFYPEFLTGPKVYIDFLLTYSKSHTRATPYFVGMFAGYVYYKLQGTNVHVCRIKSATIIMVSLLFMIISVFSAKVFYNPYHKYNEIEAASYAGFHRLTWALGSFGLFYVASYGHADFFKQILSWSPWIPLSKLVYGAYLTHMSFQLRAAAQFKTPGQVAIFDIMCLSFSDMILSFVSALCLYLMIEAPFRKIFRELLMPSRPHHNKTPIAASSSSSGGEQMMNNNTIISNNNYEDSRL